MKIAMCRRSTRSKTAEYFKINSSIVNVCVSVCPEAIQYASFGEMQTLFARLFAFIISKTQ